VAVGYCSTKGASRPPSKVANRATGHSRAQPGIVTGVVVTWLPSRPGSADGAVSLFA